VGIGVGASVGSGVGASVCAGVGTAGVGVVSDSVGGCAIVGEKVGNTIGGEDSEPCGDGIASTCALQKEREDTAPDLLRFNRN
jgi:hypothetical protein